MGNEEFVLVTTFDKDKRSSYYNIHKRDKRLNRQDDRFKKINGRLYVKKDFYHDKERSKVEELYFDILPYFNSERAMSSYFAKRLHISLNALYAYFRLFKLSNINRNDKLLKLFQEYKEKKEKEQNVI